MTNLDLFNEDSKKQLKDIDDQIKKNHLARIDNQRNENQLVRELRLTSKRLISELVKLQSNRFEIISKRTSYL